MDNQTISDQKRIKDLVGHEGWAIVRNKFNERILALQTVSEVADLLEAGDKEKLFEAMKLNLRLAEELFSFLREIEGTAQQAVESGIEPTRSYVVNLNEET